MRNLKLLSVHHVAFCQNATDVQDMSVDPVTGHIYMASKSTIFAIDLHAKKIILSHSLLEGSNFLSDADDDDLIGIQSLEQSGVCLVSRSGKISIWDTEDNKLDCVGSVSNGFTAMKWSPDLELLVLTTGTGTLLMMSQEFDAITELPLHSSDFGEDELMTVGWGQKETQFHGSEGKQAAHNLKEHAFEPVCSMDDRKTRIQWRYDGRFFAISSINTSTSSRCIRVWSRDCILQSTTESLLGLEQALSWKPRDGALIASTLRMPNNRHDVVFFERNGLRHGEFTLNSSGPDLNVLELLWNVDASILAVWCQCLDSEEKLDASSGASCVQLWSSSNYHWSLKQTLNFDSFNDCIATLDWDLEQACCLRLMTTGGHYLQYTWTWTVNRSVGQMCSDPVGVFVIDGYDIRVTPMRQMVIPPPMSSYIIKLSSFPAQVLSPASPADMTHLIGVLTHDNRFLVYSNEGGENNVHEDASDCDKCDRKSDNHTLRNCYSLIQPSSSFQFPLSIVHLCWPRLDTLVFGILGRNGPFLSCAQLSNTIGQQQQVVLSPPIPLPSDVACLSSHPCSPQCVAVLLSDGDMLRLVLDEQSIFPWEVSPGVQLHIPHRYIEMEITTFNEEEAVVGLTDGHRLSVNRVEVMSNCSSFAVHTEFLLATTFTNVLSCISRHTSITDISSTPADEGRPFGEIVRRVERGVRIVCVVPDDTKVVLQAPRGNLETVHPRVLVLSSVRRMLDRYEYGASFSMMRRHRINLNLLHDHSSPAFFSHIDVFLQQVHSASNVNLFLTELREEDVTATMYNYAYIPPHPLPSVGQSRSSVRSESSSKIDRICDSLRVAMEEMGAHRYQLSILTSYVKKSKPDLQSALELVWKLQGSRDDTSSLVSADEALKFLIFLVDVDCLYDAALTTYNLDLVLMVAERSQKDPKEYVSFLNRLRRMDENYRKYTIDKLLGNFSSALCHIVLAGDDFFAECVDFVKEHTLCHLALTLYPVGSQQFQTLSLAYGKHLTAAGHLDDAGISFARAGLWQPALEAFVAALSWQQAVCAAFSLGLDAARVAEIARSLAACLKDVNRHREAATLYEQYAKDVEEAVVAYIDGAHWDDALRLMYSHCRTDIIDTHLKGAIDDACNGTVAMLENQRRDMECYVARLSVVRQERDLHQKLMIEAMGVGTTGQMESDLLSDISSVTGESIPMSQYTANSSKVTMVSQMSGRTRKSQRKAVHKRWSLKEGSPYEHCALVEAVANTITFVDSMREEIQALLKVLMQFHQVKQSEHLQHIYQSFLEEIQQIIPDVWSIERPAVPVMRLGPEKSSNAVANEMLNLQPVTSTNSPAACFDRVLRLPPLVRKHVKWELYMLRQSADTKVGTL